MAAKTKNTSVKAPLTLKSFDPQTGEVVAEIPTVAPGEVADVVAQARKVAPEWAGIPPEGRVRILKEVRHRIYDLMDEIVETVSQECGKPRTEALSHDVLPVVVMLSYLEKVTPKVLRPQRVGRVAAPLLGGATSKIDWRPFGVVGAITPWNYPITNSFLAFAAPLFAGNVVVIKPSEVTPRCGELLRKILDPLPSGVATIIQGGGDVGAALVDAPCDKISFIGSPNTGRRICEAAAKHLTPVVMELGGKDSAIVCADADLDVASSGVLWGSFFNSGQTCCSIERVYVVDEVADEFKNNLLNKLGQLRQGRTDNDLGTLTFPNQLRIVQEQLADAVGKGATVLAGGPDAGIKNEDGTLWHAPTIIENATDEMKVLTEETFGPVITLTPVRDEDEAVRRANEEAVNLTTSVWTSSRSRAESLARRLKAGGVGSNLHGVLPAFSWAPWGGVGESGFGRLNGELGLKEFSVPVHVSHNLMKSKYFFWFPYNQETEDFGRANVKLFGARTLGERLSALKQVATSASKVIKSKL